MQLQKLLAEEQAVSSVIATILMVAVVVILAALIGTFVLGLGSENAEVGPSASISIEAGSDYIGNNGASDDSNDGVTITHEGGDDIERSTVQIIIGNTRFLNDSGGINGSGGADGDQISGLFDPDAAGTGSPEAQNPDSPWSSGDSYIIVENSDVEDGLIEDGDTVRVVWQSQNTNQTVTLAKDTISL